MENKTNNVIVETMYAITNKEDIPLKPGIYYFINTDNGKYYIGQAENIKKRYQHHMTCLKNRKQQHIYSAIRKYGFDKFEYGIIEVYDEPVTDELKDLLDNREKYFIKLFNSYGTSGYNETIGGNAGVRGLKMTDEQKKKISKNSSKIANDGRNDIFCYDICTKEIILAHNIPELSNILGTLISYRKTTKVYKNHYLITKTLDELNKQIKQYNSDNYKKDNLNYTKEQENDIINGMNYIDFSIKYNVSQKTYYNYKNNINKNNPNIIHSSDTKLTDEYIDWYEVYLYYNENGSKNTLNKYAISSPTLYRHICKFKNK